MLSPILSAALLVIVVALLATHFLDIKNSRRNND
jgi:hypothetical protein